MKDMREEFCRTFVVATQTRGAGGAVRMRSYDCFAGVAFRARIWEVARATTAAPTFFLPIEIGDVTYGDGGTGYNNPTMEAMKEAHHIWPDSPIGCLVSIGTGLENALQLSESSQKISALARLVLEKTDPRSGFRLAVAEYCINCLTSCENVHRAVAEHPEGSIADGNYFRLNVPQGLSKIGLDEWHKFGDIIALTNSYMMHGEMLKPKQTIAELLSKPQLASVSNS